MRGRELEDGRFQVIDHCLPGMAPTIPRPVPSAHQQRSGKILLFSGLEITGNLQPGEDFAAREILLDLIQGNLTSTSSVLSKELSGIIILGNSTSPPKRIDDSAKVQPTLNYHGLPF